FDRHRRCAAALREGARALGLELFARGDALSNTVTVLRAPEGIDSGAIVRHLYERHHTVIAGARNRLAGKVIRIGTMGSVEAPDILADLHYLEATLADLGQRVTPGAGVAAAARLLV